MNGSFYQTPTFPGANDATPTTPPGNISYDPTNDGEQSYIENILRLNKGQEVKAYVSYPDSIEWKDKIYDGIIEEAGRDHLILSDPKTGHWYLIRMIYLNYVEFNDRIHYSHAYSEKTF